MKKLRRTLFFLLPALFLLLVAVFSFHGFDRFLFRRMTDRFFVQSLENDALSLHYTLADPESYGICQKTWALPVYDKQSRQKSAESIKAFYKQLRRLHPGRLSKQDRYTYRLLTSYLETEMEGAPYLYYEEPLSPTSGMQSELPLLLAEYTFRNREDITAYLSLLESIPSYLEGLAEYESQKAAAGLFMPMQDLETVMDQCSSILDEHSLSQNNHFLQTTFTGRLDRLCREGQITAEEITRYSQENTRLLSTVVLPAYQKLADDLALLSADCTEVSGLYDKPDGRNYYNWLVKRTTGSTLDTEAMYRLLQKQFQKEFATVKSLVEQYRDKTAGTPDPSLLTDKFPLSDPSEILSDLQRRMSRDFPSLGALSDEPINCAIKDVDATLESYTSPAFYMTPPLDDLTHNTICINRSSTSTGLELYTTLAHEGYPGHLYQTVYSSLYGASQKESPVRKLLSYGGYTEGWAYYTERLSFTYATLLLSDNEASLLCQLAAAERDLQINLFCLLDISLHYYGASKNDIVRSLESFGIAGETAERIYTYLRTSPAAYLKYYVGYLEMLALRERARAQWGEDFSLLRFHRFVLEAGPSDFPNLNRRLQSGTDSVPDYSSSSIAAKYALSHSNIRNFTATSTAGCVKY